MCLSGLEPPTSQDRAKGRWHMNSKLSDGHLGKFFGFLGINLRLHVAKCSLFRRVDPSSVGQTRTSISCAPLQPADPSDERGSTHTEAADSSCFSTKKSVLIGGRISRTIRNDTDGLYFSASPVSSVLSGRLGTVIFVRRE